MNEKGKMRFHFSVKNEKGSSAVEFALVLPLFLAVFFGIIEYGWVMTQKIVLSHAVAAGARAAIKMPDGTSDDELATAAKNAAKAAFSLVGTLADSDIGVDIKPEGSLYGQPVPKRISVEASRTYTPLVGYLPDAAVPDTLGAKAILAFP